MDDIPHAARCSFCGSYQPTRRVEQNPSDDFVQCFRFFCSASHQANFETNQPRPVDIYRYAEPVGLFG